jgi:hypothetical protein
MKVLVAGGNEWYPVIDLTFPDDPYWDGSQDDQLVEVDDETAARWRSVYEAFHALQLELDKFLEDQP